MGIWHEYYCDECHEIHPSGFGSQLKEIIKFQNVKMKESVLVDGWIITKKEAFCSEACKIKFEGQ